MRPESQASFQADVWVPRLLIGLSILFLVYFTQSTYRFRGTYDETFLAPENLALVRGPWANEEYYRLGELDYEGIDPFQGEELPKGMDDASMELLEELSIEDLDPENYEN